jgi:CRISPR-associated protein Csx10
VERLEVTVIPESALCFSERRPGSQFHESLGYVPGSAIRAAAAMAMMEAGTDRSTDAAFRALFLGDRPAVFRNAYPSSGVLPATAMSCKAHPGFLGDQSADDEKHGVIDTLVERLCFEALEPAGLQYLPKCALEDCNTRLERYGGFYWPGDRKKASAPQRLLTRVGINRRRSVAEEGLLYSPIVISEALRRQRKPAEGAQEPDYIQTEFRASIIARDYSDILRSHLAAITHLGGGTSRGLGQVAVEVEAPGSGSGEQPLSDRTKSLNDQIVSFWQLLKALPCNKETPFGPENGSYFTVGLNGDAILRKEEWLSTGVLTADMLRQHCGVQDDTVRLVRSYSGHDYRGGWNLQWGLPKDVELATPMGSVFVFWTEQIDRWYEALQELETWGIGQRTAEGFGQVMVCDPFHVYARRENPA